MRYLPIKKTAESDLGGFFFYIVTGYYFLRPSMMAKATFAGTSS